MKFSNKSIFFTIVTIQITLILLSLKILDPIALLEANLFEQLDLTKMREVIEKNKQWLWISLSILPLILFLKLSLVVLSLKIGCILLDFNTNKLYKIVLYSEFVFISMGVFKLSWLIHMHETLTLNYLKTYSPLSLYSLLDIPDLAQWLIHPLQTFNLFEVFYWFLLAWLLSKELHVKFWKSFEFVMSTYGLGLLIWVVFGMFLTINLS